MIEVIPSINVLTFSEVRERIARVEPYVKWCHLDVTDGIFSPHLTWNHPADLVDLNTSLNVEVHLMVQEPEEVIDRWLVKPIKRIIVHFEATENLEVIFEKCRAAGKEIGIAIRPDTPWEALGLCFDKVDLIQVLGVSPGPSGQVASEEIFSKLSHIRIACPACVIEFDGGVNPEIAKRAAASGANLLVSGSYIFNSEDIGIAVQELLRAASVPD